MIFRILQYFATKLDNITNFNMLFLAVVKDFAFAKMKIQFKMGMVNLENQVSGQSCVKERSYTLWPRETGINLTLDLD